MLGVGAQKSGTTWLHNYLKSSRQYDNGIFKEYHVFDAQDLPSEEWMLRRLTRLGADAVANLRAGVPADAAQLQRLAMLADNKVYFDYFTALVTRGRKVRATGDLTPDNAMLSAARMTGIRDEFDKRGVRTVGVFLMRDPVERVWSHIRMKDHRHPDRVTGTSEDRLLHAHADEPYWLRTQYHQTLDNLSAALSPEAVHVGLYETLFRDDEQTRAISSLVGIPFVEPDFTSVRNFSPRAVDALPEEVARVVATHYAATYRGVAERLPHLDIARWWPHSRHVL